MGSSDRGAFFSASARARPPDWRDEMRAASLCNLLAGLWIAASPWGLDYSRAEATWNSVVTGSVVALIAFVRVAGAYRASWLSWANAFAGIWLTISAFALPQSGIALWNSLVFGLTVFGLACWSARASQRGSPVAGPGRDRRPEGNPRAR